VSRPSKNEPLRCLGVDLGSLARGSRFCVGVPFVILLPSGALGVKLPPPLLSAGLVGVADLSADLTSVDVTADISEDGRLRRGSWFPPPLPPEGWRDRSSLGAPPEVCLDFPAAAAVAGSMIWTSAEAGFMVVVRHAVNVRSRSIHSALTASVFISCLYFCSASLFDMFLSLVR